LPVEHLFVLLLTSRHEIFVAWIRGWEHCWRLGRRNPASVCVRSPKSGYGMAPVGAKRPFPSTRCQLWANLEKPEASSAGLSSQGMLADLEHARSGKRIQYCSQEFAVAVAPAGGRKPRVW